MHVFGFSTAPYGLKRETPEYLKKAICQDYYPTDLEVIAEDPDTEVKEEPTSD